MVIALSYLPVSTKLTDW